jgi:hypothetical protein
MKHYLHTIKLKLTTILFGLAIFLCGCSTSYLVNSTGKPDAKYNYGEMNEELKGQDVEIELKDGSDISAKNVEISEDSVSWVDQETDQTFKASTPEINKIVIESSLMGALEGAGFGLVGGAGLGALFGQILIGNDTELGTGGGAIVGLVLGGGTGLIVGSITGAIIGHSYNYKFPTAEQSDSLQIGK